jgi:cysteine desulfurase/selenocysteine lyase
MHRELFPVTARYTYLNSAAESPLNVRTHGRICEYLSATLAAPHTKPSAVRSEVRQLLASLLGGAAEDFALVGSTCQGINIVAAGLPWVAGENVVLPEGEHWNNTFPWLALKARGVEVRRVPLAADNSVPPERFAALVDGRTRVVACAHVQFATGARADLKRLAMIAHSVGALLVVDGIQGAGAVPLHLVEDGVDAYAAGGFKWLLGAPGTGFLYVAPSARARIAASLPGMFSASPSFTELAFLPDARAYESGSIAYALFHGWVGGLRLLLDVGVAAIHERNMALTGALLAGLAGKPHVRVVSPIAEEAGRSAIVVVALGGAEEHDRLCARLCAGGVVVANRGDAGVRISVNFFNTEADVAKLLELL